MSLNCGLWQKIVILTLLRVWYQVNRIFNYKLTDRWLLFQCNCGNIMPKCMFKLSFEVMKIYLILFLAIMKREFFSKITTGNRCVRILCVVCTRLCIFKLFVIYACVSCIRSWPLSRCLWEVQLKVFNATLCQKWLPFMAFLHSLPAPHSLGYLIGKMSKVSSSVWTRKNIPFEVIFSIHGSKSLATLLREPEPNLPKTLDICRASEMSQAQTKAVREFNSPNVAHLL